MSCPHSSAPGSNPQSCSLCIGTVVKTVVVADGRVSVDGKDIGSLQDINRGRYESETQNSLPQKRKSCGRCGGSGHNRVTCYVKLPTDTAVQDNDESVN